MSGDKFFSSTEDDVSKVVSLILPDDAESLLLSFWGSTALTSISGKNIKTVSESDFNGCIQLATVSFPEATKIENYAFNGCMQLATVSFPEATEIGDYAFKDCTKLATVNLPEATNIGLSAFSDCRKLSSVSVDVAEIIGDYAFSGCWELSSVDLSKATQIGDYAFYYCTGLSSVDLRAATDIGYKVFSSTGGTALTVTLGDTVPTLDPDMFYGVSSAKTVTVRVPSNATDWNGKTGTFSGDNTQVKWGNGFRGGGWTQSGAFVYGGGVNTYISLTVETY